jgi:hypothetical protein
MCCGLVVVYIHIVYILINALVQYYEDIYTYTQKQIKLYSLMRAGKLNFGELNYSFFCSSLL